MIEAELLDGTILEFPDGTTPDVMRSAVQRMGKQKPAQPQDNLFQRIAGATIEPAAAITTGLLGGVVGSAAGVGKSIFGGKYGTQEGVRQGDKFGGEVAQSMTYQPRTQTGQAVVGKIGQLVNDSGLIAVAPMAGELSALARAAPSASRAIADKTRVEAGYAGDAMRAGAQAVGESMPSPLKAAGAFTRPVANAFSNRYAQQSALEQIRGAVDPATLQRIGPKGDIPLSAAAVTQSPELARMEQASRLRNPATWYGFDQNQGKAVFDKVNRATSDATQVSARQTARQENWKANWADVEKSVDPQVFGSRLPKFQQNIETALQSSEAVNPAVRGMLESIKAEIARTGDNFSPAHLQQIRANLSGKYNPMSPNAYASAPRDSSATRSVLREVDDILNASTGGVWSKVPAAYKADSALLHEAKAASKIRGSFVDADTGRVRGVSLDPSGDIPKITEAGLGRSMDAARMPGTQKLALSPQAENELSRVVEALRNQNIVQGVKRTASAGGGSDSISNITSLAATAAPGGMTKNVLQQLFEFVGNKAKGRTNSQLAELLADPQQLQALMAKDGPTQANKIAEILRR